MNFTSMREALTSLSRSNAGVASAVLLSMAASIALWTVFPNIDDGQFLHFFIDCIDFSQYNQEIPDAQERQYIYVLPGLLHNTLAGIND